MKELIKIQSELNAPKKQFNKFGNYAYRSAEDILEALKPLLLKYELQQFINDEIVQVGDRIYVKAIVTLTNKDGETITASAFAREDETKKGMDGSQITGAASSYARKYALNGLYCIDDSKDSDYLNTGDGTKAIATIEEAIADVQSCKTSAEVALKWTTYKMYHSDIKFKTIVSQRGAELKKQENGKDKA